MLNDWVHKLIDLAENDKFHGKIELNIHAGVINNVEKRERINRPADDKISEKNILQEHRQIKPITGKGSVRDVF